MFTPVQRLLSKVTLVALILLTTACEGGKSRDPVACEGGTVDHLGRCVSGASPCPTGQVTVGGQCVDTGSQCQAGFHSVNGECVPNTMQCDPGHHQVGDACVADTLQVDIINQSACWNPTNGITEMVVQYITRDERGFALDPEYDANQMPTAVLSELLINGAPMDVEARLQRDAELLNSNLLMSLVLDASYSMLEHQTPAFEPMKSSAMELLLDVQSTWQASQADFHWELAWFSTFINRPTPSPQNDVWQISDIAHIPTPQQGDYTALYKAVLHMLNEHRRLYEEEQVATGERDQHVMVILSDGANNYSYFDDSSHSEPRHANQQIYWTEMGFSQTEMADIEVAAGLVPNLRIHVIGLGSEIDEDELLHLADLGRGQYFYGDDGAAVEDIFDSVKQEFVTMQSIGIEAPLAPNTYEFTLHAKHVESGVQGQSRFAVEIDENMGDCES